MKTLLINLFALHASLGCLSTAEDAHKLSFDGMRNGKHVSWSIQHDPFKFDDSRISSVMPHKELWSQLVSCMPKIMCAMNGLLAGEGLASMSGGAQESVVTSMDFGFSDIPFAAPEEKASSKSGICCGVKSSLLRSYLDEYLDYYVSANPSLKKDAKFNTYSVLAHLSLRILDYQCVSSVEAPDSNVKALSVDSSRNCYGISDSEVDDALQFMDDSLHVMSELVEQLRKSSESDVLKEFLSVLDMFIDTVRSEIKAHGKEFAGDLCSNCKEMVQYLRQGVMEFTSILDKNYPEWRNIEFMTKLMLRVNEAISFLEEMCPSRFFRSEQLLMGDEKLKISCIQTVREIEDFISSVEGFLSEILPGWNMLPIIGDLDNLLHVFFDKLITQCTNFQLGTPSVSVSLLKSHALGIVQKGCLTPDQKTELAGFTLEVQEGMDYLSTMLTLYSELEPDEMKSFYYQEMAKAVRVLADEFVTNVTRLADEFCGSCADLVLASNDLVQTLEKSLFDIEPSWKSTPFYQAVLDMTTKAFAKISGFCTTELAVDNLKMKLWDNCLTPEQDESLKYYVSKMETFLNYAGDILDTLAAQFPEGDEKEELENTAKIMRILSSDVVDRVGDIAEEACGTCADVVKALQDSDTVLEKALTDLDPDWQQNPTYREISEGFRAIIVLAQNVCPQHGEIASVLETLSAFSPDLCERYLKNFNDVFVEAVDVGLKISHSPQFDQSILLVRDLVGGVVDIASIWCEEPAISSTGLDNVLTLNLDDMVIPNMVIN